MKRLAAFGLICVATVLFILVAFSKLSEDGLFLPSQTRVTRLGVLWAAQHSATPQPAKAANHSKLSMIVTEAQGVADDTSSSDLSSSVDVETQPPRDGPNAGGYTNTTTVSHGNDGKPVQIIVLARMRTGSSLLGEILNQNPTLFYIFEPLHAIDDFMRRHREAEVRRRGLSISLLRLISKCKFTPDFVESNSRWGLGRTKSSGLRPICHSKQGCTRSNYKQVEERCDSFGGRVAMKTIRADLSMLQDLVEQDNLNIKVIHLVRDPRGTANSRKSYYSEKRFRYELRKKKQRIRLDKIPQYSLQSLELLKEHPNNHVNTIIKYCSWINDIVPLVKSRPAWLENRYMFIRYEDLALDPVRTSQSIYDFIGITMPDSVRQFVINSTNVSNEKYNASKFGVYKNSKEVMQSWRHSLPYDEVVQVQAVCRDAMAMTGYKEVSSPEDLVDLSYDIIGDLNPALTRTGSS